MTLRSASDCSDAKEGLEGSALHPVEGGGVFIIFFFTWSKNVPFLDWLSYYWLVVNYASGKLNFRPDNTLEATSNYRDVWNIYL